MGIDLERSIELNRFIIRVGYCYSLWVIALIIPALSTTSVVAGDAAQSSEALSLNEIDSLLSRSRQAMAQGDYSLADTLLLRAEQAKPKYPVLHFGDTPARVRRDLEKLSGRRPNAASSQQAVSKSAPPTRNQVTNPFAISGQEVVEKTTPANSVASARYPAATPSGSAGEMPMPGADREQCDRMLLAARQSLVVGDSSQAANHLEKARAFQVEYSESEDSPTRIAQSLSELQQLQASKDDSASWKHGYAKFLVAQGNALLDWGDLQNAERAAAEAARLNSANGIEDTNPLKLLSRVRETRKAKLVQAHVNELPLGELAGNSSEPQGSATNRMLLDQSVAPAAAAVPIDLTLPNFDQIPSVPKLAQLPTDVPEPLPVTEDLAPEMMDAFGLLQEGEIALRAGDRAQALRLFRLAYTRRGELDLSNQQQLQDHLQMLSAGPEKSPSNNSGTTLIDSATSGQVVIARQLTAEIGKRQTEAAKLRKTDPRQSLTILEEAGELVTKSELDQNTKTQLQGRLRLSIAETERYIKEHQSEIELDEANNKVLADVDRERAVKGQVREKIAEMVDQFNRLIDEHRYAEAEVVAERLYDMAPEEPVAQQVWQNAKFIRREVLNQEISNIAEEGFYQVQEDIRRSAAQGLLQSNDPITFGDNWAELNKGRKGSSDRNSYRSERELEIERKLRTPILPSYNDMPLAEVVDVMSKLAGINIHLDPRGLSQEGVQSDTTVSLNLGKEISLKSALSLILEPLHLTYMIKDEVLKITSEQIRDGDLVTRTYNVADLVIPIPNFVPSNNMGLQGLINDAYAAVPFSNGARQSAPVAMVPGGPAQEGMLPGGAMAQQFGANSAPGSSSVPLGGGPGGLGGAANADFDSLIDLIVTTVEYDSWMENGSGEGEIQPFPTNLSLVISQTQKVHDQIRDLLEQLRRLQDLQVTIEVRFIRLSDQFFERIGIDFDFNIEDGSAIANLTNSANPRFEPNRASATVGISSNPTGLSDPLPDFTVDLDIPFRNNAFGLTEPNVGGFQDVGSFGFAILSDIEAFFLINASQGDQRSNVLQAPKVTLFNGQQGIVADTSLRPFVISVIPVVGEFAAAQQPVIVVLSEGTLLTVQAVVSDDRRYVRLTLVPFFSQIGDVDTFTFEGSETTSTSNSTNSGQDGNDETNDTAQQVVRSGTTVQLPTFQIITVATTVSVPDGGTVLLGGVKRLSEQRSEFGVPLLGKIPYIDRLFRNVGIGRDTNSLMMMVTPHIIIQEEEEERLGISQE